MRYDDVPDNCTCMALGPFDHMRVWQRRAQPIITRWLRRGRPVDATNMKETLRLVTLMETGDPDCFAAVNFHRSHHLQGCPWRQSLRAGMNVTK